MSSNPTPRPATVPLSKLRPGQQGVVETLDTNGPASLRLRELGLLPGTPVQLLRFAPLGDPLEIRLRGFCLSLRKKEAAGIFLRVSEAGAA
ncbi:MAG: ferrous iron transport protein A [Opitutales bacterium]